MEIFPDSWKGSAIICVLGGALFLAHLVHATRASESLQTVIFGILFPMLVSVGVLLGGIWLWQSMFTSTAARRVASWCMVGILCLSLGTVFTILSQQAHGVQMADQQFVVLNSASLGSLIGFVVGIYDVQRHRQKRLIQKREHALQDLHTATREIIQTSGTESIAMQAVEAARDILDLPINGCWLYDDTEDILRPVAATEEGTELIKELPTYTKDESLSWEAFETGEVMIFDDIRKNPNRHSADTPIRSEIILPLGDYGVMNIGSTETNAFDEMDVSLARILAANTQTALERADREQELASAHEKATHLNRQLTVLNRVFRHDLRNAANVIQGHAELLVESTDSETIRGNATTVREQAGELVEMGEQVRDIERILQNDVREQKVIDIVDIIITQLDRVERDYPAAQTNGPSCETCHVYAHSLIESAIRNVIENAVEHNDKQIPQIDVEISEAGDNFAEIRVSDNGPGIPETEVAVLERGYETPLEHTSGLGLWLVSWIVRESDGEVSFQEKSPNGSIVSLQFEKASPETPVEDRAVQY